MKCFSLLSGKKNKKNIISCLSAEFTHRLEKIKGILYHYVSDKKVLYHFWHVVQDKM